MKEKIRVDEAASLTAPTAKVYAERPFCDRFGRHFLRCVHAHSSFCASRPTAVFKSHEIVGTLTDICYNPLINVVRFLLIVLLPAICIDRGIFRVAARVGSATLSATCAEKNEAGLWIWRQKAFVPVLIVATFLVALDTKSYLSVGDLETFEEGHP